MNKKIPSASGEERRNEIVRLVMAESSIAITTLSEHFGVSKMTVHRDLDLLERRGLVRKTHGNVTAEPSLLFESNFHYRLHRQPEHKRHIATAAARLIEPGAVIMIDDSTTALPMTESIAQMDSLTVITYAQAVIERLESHHQIDLICAGGTYGRMFRAYHGLLCEQVLSKLRANFVFVSAPAVEGTTLFHQSEEDVRLKRVMMEASEQRVLLLDHTKFHRTALNHFADLSEFDRIFVDDSLDAATLRDLRERGLPIELVGGTEAGSDPATPPETAEASGRDRNGSTPL